MGKTEVASWISTGQVNGEDLSPTLKREDVSLSMLAPVDPLLGREEER